MFSNSIVTVLAIQYPVFPIEKTVELSSAEADRLDEFDIFPVLVHLNKEN